MKQLYYMTTLSNWLLGYDKYSKNYSKSLIKESSFPNQFYLVDDHQAQVALDKANKLLLKLNINNNYIIKINTKLDESIVNINLKNMKGYVIDQNYIPVESVEIYINNEFQQISIEELTAKAYKLKGYNFEYNELKPRSISFLPVAQACQAKCWFCFSESSISLTKDKTNVDFILLEKILKESQSQGAERFVITGGGEPGLLPFEQLLNVIKIGKKYFNKIVLISNGMFLSYKTEKTRIVMINKLIDAGLSVLSISRHHYNEIENQQIMGVDTKTNNLFQTINDYNLKIDIRLICVLQKQGIANEVDIQSYLNFASIYKINQVCFKELYVSSGEESLYNTTKENKYSESQQVTLGVLTDFLMKNNYIKVLELPWGSPVFKGDNIYVAAYTEPSVGWERTVGICRSWNIMADMKVYASLEDLDSKVEISYGF